MKYPNKRNELDTFYCAAGAAFRCRREEMGWTQPRAGAEIGKDRFAIMRIERGEARCMDQFIIYAHALGLRWADVVIAGELAMIDSRIDPACKAV